MLEQVTQTHSICKCSCNIPESIKIFNWYGNLYSDREFPGQLSCLERWLSKQQNRTNYNEKKVANDLTPYLRQYLPLYLFLSTIFNIKVY